MLCDDLVEQQTSSFAKALSALVAWSEIYTVITHLCGKLSIHRKRECFPQISQIYAQISQILRGFTQIQQMIESRSSLFSLLLRSIKYLMHSPDWHPTLRDAETRTFPHPFRCHPKRGKKAPERNTSGGWYAIVSLYESMTSTLARGALNLVPSSNSASRMRTRVSDSTLVSSSGSLVTLAMRPKWG